MHKELRTSEQEEGGFYAEDSSYPLVRAQLHAPYLGISVPAPDGGEELEARLSEFLHAAIDAQGLERPKITVSSWDVGRSAGGVEILACVGLGLAAVVAMAAGIKKVDDALPVVRKWARALSSAVSRLHRAHFTVEALKLLCVDDLLERFGEGELPDMHLMATAAIAGQFGDGTWRVIDPHYIIIPDRINGRTHLYVVQADGAILHRAELPDFYPRIDGLDPVDDGLVGYTSNASAVSEESVVDERSRAWSPVAGSHDARKEEES